MEWNLLIIAVSLLLIGGHVTLCDEEAKEKEKPSETPPNVKIKIVEAPASRITPYQAPGAKDLKLRIKPANISGPAHLYQLAAECYMLSENGYEYKVCPFDNVTQREERVAWNSFHGVLGVWREWLVENDTLVGMHYVMGQECSVGDREVKVLFNCSTVTRLHSTSEPKTCHYIVVMDTPLACLKGAMQIYHLLNNEQLKEWEQFDVEYYSDELTFQGLEKRRRRILTAAGLLFDREKEKTRLAEEKRVKEEEEAREKEKREKEQANHPSYTNPLSSCEKERDDVKKVMKDLMTKIRRVIKEYPAVAFKLGLLQNDTHQSPPPPTVEIVREEKKMKDQLEEKVVEEGEKKKEEEEEMRGREREEEEVGKEWSRGGFLDHNEVEDGGDEDNLLKEVNEEVEERDRREQEMNERQRWQDEERNEHSEHHPVA